jgi:hypothetical protein
VSRAADKHDIAAVADVLAVSIGSALVSGHSYTYEDARRTNADEGWTYDVTTRRRGDMEHVEAMHLSEEQLSLAWLTATRHVDNDMDVWS